MRLGVFDLVRAAVRSFYIQAVWSYERMLSLGFCFALIPFARKMLKSAKERRLFLKRNLTFFNTNPYMAGWLIGAVMRLEEEALTAEKPAFRQHERFKSRMSQSLAAIGDQLFWERLRPLTALLGWMVAMYWGVAGAVVFLVTYNIPHLFMRFKGVVTGYRLGFDITKEISLKKLHKRSHDLLRVGALATGLAFVVAARSAIVDNPIQIAGFVGGIVGMFILLKIKIPVPVALTVLLIACAVFGGLLGHAEM